MAKHDERPREAGPDAQLVAKAERLLASPYTASIKPLAELVRGSVVRSSLSGHSGFALLFEGDTWVVCFLDEGALRWKHGQGSPSPTELALLASPNFGDARSPLAEDRPYAGEACEIAAEIANAHGKPVTSLAYGEKSFNFCFPQGRELETSVVPAADGRLGLRVFWEQW